jgi:hydrogenase maturation protease
MVETMQDCVIIGIGNLLHGDDGVGVHAVKYLEGKVPENVRLVEGGVYSLDLLVFLEGVSHAIFIDAVDVEDEPGAIYRFSPQDVMEQPKTPLSVHDLGLYDLIGAAELLDQRPEHITIIAVQVKSLEMGMDLSPELRKALPRIHGLILEEINAAR